TTLFRSIGEFFSDAFTTRQRTAQNAGATRFATLNRRVIILFVLIFILVFIDTCIVAAGTVTGKGKNIEDKAADLLSDAHPRPAGEQRQPGRPEEKQRKGAAAAVEHRLQRGTQ